MGKNTTDLTREDIIYKIGLVDNSINAHRYYLAEKTENIEVYINDRYGNMSDLKPILYRVTIKTDDLMRSFIMVEAETSAGDLLPTAINTEHMMYFCRRMDLLRQLKELEETQNE